MGEAFQPIKSPKSKVAKKKMKVIKTNGLRAPNTHGLYGKVKKKKSVSAGFGSTSRDSRSEPKLMTKLKQKAGVGETLLASPSALAEKLKKFATKKNLSESAVAAVVGDNTSNEQDSDVNDDEDDSNDDQW